MTIVNNGTIIETQDVFLNTSSLDIFTKIKEERVSQNMTLEYVSEKLKINKEYIKMIESGRTQDLPLAGIYTKHLIKKYTNLLGMDIEDDLEKIIVIEEKKDPMVNSKKYQTHNQNLPQIIRIITVGIILTIFLVYLGFQLQNILKPPSLTVYSPENGQITQESNIIINGKTDSEVSISINGRDVKNEENGEFTEKVNLNKGLNTITVTAQKKYGKTTSETRYVILKENQEFSYVE